MNRIGDWSELNPEAKRFRQNTARTHAHALSQITNAFVEIAPPAPLAAAGSLNGLPYAAKDIFRTSAREPGCGFGTGF